MIDVIWRLRGSVSLDDATSDESALARVESLLTTQCKPIAERSSDHLLFDAPLLTAMPSSNWLAMIIYDRGRFWIDRGEDRRRLRYDLRSLHALVFCLLAALFAFLTTAREGGPVGGLKYAAFAFGWLYGMNILLALARVPSAIHRAVNTP